MLGFLSVHLVVRPTWYLSSFKPSASLSQKGVICTGRVCLHRTTQSSRKTFLASVISFSFILLHFAFNLNFLSAILSRPRCPSQVLLPWVCSSIFLWLLEPFFWESSSFVCIVSLAVLVICLLFTRHFFFNLAISLLHQYTVFLFCLHLRFLFSISLHVCMALFIIIL